MMHNTRQKISAVLKMNTPDAKPLNSTSAESIITSPKPRCCFDSRLTAPSMPNTTAAAARFAASLEVSIALAAATAYRTNASHSENSLALRSCTQHTVRTLAAVSIRITWIISNIAVSTAFRFKNFL